jgi:hypothetical protein
MTTDSAVVEPDEVWERDGETIGLFGQGPCVPYDQPIDPIPSVYASYGEIETGDYRFKLDEAEQYAARILTGVRWQRARLAEKRAAELNAMATGAAATHDWHQPDSSATCRRCRTVAYGDELLVAGVVPPCGTPCPKGWHEISAALSGDEGDAVCIFCKASWSAERLYVLMDRQWQSLAVGPFLTFDQAFAISDAGPEFVPIQVLREEALTAVADAKGRQSAGLILMADRAPDTPTT